MAIAFRSKGSVINNASGTSTVVPTPAGVQANDLMIAFVANINGTGALTIPAGWSQLATYAPTTVMRSALLYRLATASEPASVTFTWGAAGRNFGIIVAYSGVDLAGLVSANYADGTAASAGPFTLPAVNTTSTSWLVGFIAGRENPGTDDVKSWTTSAATDVEREDFYTNNTGTGAKLTGAAWDTNGPIAVGGTGAAPPVAKFNQLVTTSTLKIGATVKEDETTYWETRLSANKWMRIFPNSDGLPPDWENERFQYLKRVGGQPFVSTKIDGDGTKLGQLSTWIQAMPSWVTRLYITDRHEPEGDLEGGAPAYIANFTAFWNMIQALPSGIRAKVWAGPVQTNLWTEDATKGNFNYGTYDPGVGDFWGVDAYGPSYGSGATVTTSFKNPVAFFQYIKAYHNAHPTRPMILPEVGYIGAPFDTDGTARAAWLQGMHDEFKTFANPHGFIWWNTQGKSGAALSGNPGIGTFRYFQLDRRHTDDQGGYETLAGAASRELTSSKVMSSSHVWAISIPGSATDPVVPGANAWSYAGVPLR